MKIERTKELDTLMEQAVEFNGRRREEIHVSDIQYCLAKPYFRRMNVPEQVEFASKLAMKLGAIHGKIFGFSEEGEIKRFGVVGHVDKRFNELALEFKTTRGFHVPDRDPSEHYLTQVRYYAVMSGQKQGYLAVCYFIKKNGDNGRYEAFIDRFKITLTDQEVKDTEKEIVLKRKALEKALAEVKPPTIYTPTYKWECKCCGFAYRCPILAAKKGKKKPYSPQVIEKREVGPKK